MKLRTTVQLLCVLLVAMSIASYLFLCNASSLWEEFLLAGSVLGIAGLYVILHVKVFTRLKALEHVVRKSGEQLALKAKEENEGIISLATATIASLSANIRQASNMVGRLKSGNLAEDTLKLKETDPLIMSLEELRAQLQGLQRDEGERNWTSDGMAKFVDILKAEYKSEKAFYDQVVSSVVKYMEASQGGLFLFSDNELQDDPHLSLVSCYAYEKHKALSKRIDIGQGIVGQVYLEKQTVLLKQVPDKYVSITSGLGHATPSNILIVPFKLNESVECIMELASFSTFERYQIQFLEKLGESIASKVSNLRVSEQTNKLLKETQLYTEQLRAQEEEMRQNMEELTATQEEMARKEQELSRLLEQSTKDQVELKGRLGEIEKLKEQNQRESARMLELQEKYQHDIVEMLNQIPAKIFLKDSNGLMVLCNKTVADGYNLSVKQLIGTHDRDHFDHEQVKMWEKQEQEIMVGGKKTFVQEERFQNKTRFLKTTKMPFHIHHLNQTGIMGFQFDVTESLGAERTEKELREEIARLRGQRVLSER
jgi:PAS domain S-box-containing protein